LHDNLIGKCAVFNLVCGTIIGLVIGASIKLLMEKEKCGNLSGVTVVGVGGSVVMGSLVGLLDPSFGIIASYFGAFFSLVIYALIKTRRELYMLDSARAAAKPSEGSKLFASATKP